MGVEKIVSFEMARERVGEARMRGMKVVLANGCFDILHVGHVRYLQSAKELGDLLVVAINSDWSVERYKGKAPVVPQDERAELVSCLEMVDMVFIFDDPSLHRVIGELKPHIQAKGTDYTPDTVPEAEVVRSYGGEVVICGDPKDHSSTEMKERLSQRQ
jgi:rfaE bifunctional protein nucleotidyltransferase chain/domain